MFDSELARLTEAFEDQEQRVTARYRFDPVDIEQMRRLARLTPARRIRLMLNARELAVGLIRGRLRRRYPELDVAALNLKLLEELDRVARTRS